MTADTPRHPRRIGRSTSPVISLDSLPMPALLTDHNAVTDANRAAAHLFGVVSIDTLVGIALPELFELGASLDDQALMTRDSRLRRPWRQATARRRDGHGTVPVLISDLPLNLTDAANTATLTTILPDSLVSASPTKTGSADEVSREELARLFANLAHEMRTPLNAIIGFSEIMVGRHFGDLNDRYAEYAKDIKGAGQHLAALVNGALDLGRANAGKDGLLERPLAVADLITSTLPLVDSHARTKNIELSVPTSEGLPIVLGDATRLRQLLVNLITNAIKYSPPSARIIVACKTLSSGDLGLVVRDNGFGMTEDEIRLAILPFGRTETAINAGEPGTGLGLPICKAIVESHGGRLIIDSVKGKGTTIVATLPARRVISGLDRASRHHES